MWMVFTLTTAWAGEPLPNHMQGHFASATDAMWYVAAADLDTTRAKAAELDHAQHDQLPKALRGYVEDMRSKARLIAKAESVPQARVAVAGLAGSCAGCHTTAKDGPRVHVGDVDTLPDDGPKSAHIWGTYAAWVGLITDSTEVWQHGMDRMASLPSAAMSEPTTALIAQRQAELVDKGRTDADLGARIATFDQLLTTCSACHAPLGVRVVEVR